MYQYLANSTGTINGDNCWFSPASFSNTRLTTANSNRTRLTAYPYGKFLRNALRGPGQTNLDLTISKHFFITERLNVELRGDAFNMLNHTEFQNPDNTITSGVFGQISTTYDPLIL